MDEPTPAPEVSTSSPVTPPVTTPVVAAAVTEPAKPNDPPINAATVVLQWLSYVLWECTVIALGTMLSSTLTYFFISKEDSSLGFYIYTLATLICLTPIAYVIDLFYRRREPAEQHGLGAFVLIINAVVVFVCGLGGLIGAVVAILSIILKPGSHSTTEIALIVALVFALLNGLLFLRIMAARLMPRFAKLFPFVIMGLGVLTIILTIVGPVSASYQNRDDHAIETGLPTIASRLYTYADEHEGQLPNSLSQLDISNDEYDGDAKTLIDQKKVTYSKLQGNAVQPLPTKTTNGVTITPDYIVQNDTIDPRYKLCVTFKAVKGDGQTTQPSSYGTLSLDDHPAGYTCYIGSVSSRNY